ncbi:MAG: carbohydrate kinase family protein [Patescibacteria group bacterium]|nr:carbohydrate kinase family protein [Patescibacteria group bacterium]
MKIYSIGTASLDIFFIFDNFNFLKNLKEKNDVENYFVDIGGGGLNFAYNFQKLNLDSTAIVKLGNDFIGKIIRKKIEEKKIKAHIIKSRGNSTISFIFLGKDGKKYIFTHRGDEIFKEKDIPIFNNSAYYLATGKTPVSLWLKIFNKLKRANNFVGVNPSGYFLRNFKKFSNFKNIDFLSINFQESILILKKKKLKNKDKINFLKELRKKLFFIKYLLVTDGQNGAWFLTENKIYHSDIYEKIKIIDTTGAGDSFGSTVFALLVKNKLNFREDEIKLILKYAAINTAYNLNKIGSQTGLLSWRKLKTYKKIKLEVKKVEL